MRPGRLRIELTKLSLKAVPTGMQPGSPSLQPVPNRINLGTINYRTKPDTTASKTDASA